MAQILQGYGDSDSDLDTPLLSLLPLGVASDVLLGVSDKLDLVAFEAMVGGGGGSSPNKNKSRKVENFGGKGQ